MLSSFQKYGFLRQLIIHNQSRCYFTAKWQLNNTVLPSQYNCLCSGEARGSATRGADLKFTAPRDFLSHTPKIFWRPFFSLYFSLIYGLVTLPKILYPSKHNFPFQIFGHSLNFYAPLKVPPGADRPHRPPCYATVSMLEL